MRIILTPEALLSLSQKEELRNKLDNFYQSFTDYIAFSLPSNQIECWVHIEREIIVKSNQQPGHRIKILEVGAGKSGFGKWLKTKDLREKVEWTVQDVTKQNAVWLNEQADETIYGDISTISKSERFDIIFSTYVLEHVSNPSEHLNLLYNLLKKLGNLFVFCPRYDVPLYLCPSSRHLNKYNRFLLIIKSFTTRIESVLSNKPSFLLQTDLAAFHQPFFLDADAVHWVSQLDLKYWARIKGSKLKTLKFGSPRSLSKDWFVKRFLTCAVEIVKPDF